MVAKLAGFRSGDRAETFGVALLQTFAAVAPIPRQEDVGIVDAVATLLRREGDLLYPEDSFAVQFKSRTERRIEYLGVRFQALMRQDLALFIGHVNLREARVDLYATAPVLAHPNAGDVDGLVLYLGRRKQDIDDGVLHASLRHPALTWTAADLDDAEFAEAAVEVMSSWIRLDRENRRTRALGVQTSIRWETNEPPSEAGRSVMYGSQRCDLALEHAVPTVRLLLTIAGQNLDLAVPILRIVTWMREQGVDPDAGGVVSFMLIKEISSKLLDRVLEEHEEADLAVHVISISRDPGAAEFFMQAGGRGRGGRSGHRHQGTAEGLRQAGFDVDVDDESGRVVGFAPGLGWLDEHGFRMIRTADLSDEIFLLRKVNQGD